MKSLAFILALFCFSCRVPESKKGHIDLSATTGVSLVILGTVQDGGSPHAGCKKKCCKKLFSKPDPGRKVVSLGLVDAINKRNYLLEATPDLPSQLRLLKDHSPFKTNDPPDGIFLSHAHIGHYAGLMYLGKEAMNADSIPVYVMPRMKTYLETNGPWSQLVLLKNIKLLEAQANRQVVLSSSLSITPFIVPHRDEFSETVGFKVEGPGKTALFIPDIDKWAKWQNNVAEEIKKVDYAFMDATFFDAAEIQNRDISLIPHPFVVESMKMFEALPREEKNKIYFIHFNHTNPLLDPGSGATDRVLKAGFNVSVIGQVFHL